jgi:hypothetical protein
MENFSENPQGRKPLSKPKCNGEDNIKNKLRCIGPEVLDWNQLAQNRVYCRAWIIENQDFLLKFK